MVVLALFLGIILAIVFLVYVAKIKPIFNYRVLVILSGAAILWLFANSMELLMPALEQKILWNNLTFIGIVIVPVSFFVFVMQYSGYKTWSKTWNIIFISVFPFIFMVMNLTNRFHYLAVKDFALLSHQGQIYLAKEYGLFFWIWTAYAYLLLLISFIQLLKLLIASIRFYRWATITLITAALMPITANIIYLTGVSSLQFIDLTPLVLSLSVMALLLGVIKMNLGSIIPIAKTAVLDNMKDGVIVLDSRDRILEINPIAYDLIGEKQKNRVGRNIHDIWPDARKYLQNDDKRNPMKIKVKDQDKTLFYEVIIDLSLSYDNRLSCRTVLIRDITEREKSEKILRNKVGFAKLIARVSASFISASQGNIDQKIDKALRIIGKFAHADRSYVFLLHKNGKTMDNTHEWATNDVLAQKDNLQKLPCSEFQWWLERLQGFKDIYYDDVDTMPPEAQQIADFLRSQDIQSIAVVPMFYNDQLKGFLGFDLVKGKKKWKAEELSLLRIVGDIFINAIENDKAGKKIRYLSFYDSLTGLYNRAYFEEELKRVQTERQLPLSVIIGDINGLKLANDAFGHLEGDRLLKEAASVLKKSCRKDDTIARWGGDEFAILLPNTTERQTHAIISRIKKEVSKTDHKKLPLSISLGTATKTDMTTDIIKTIKTAEDLMYRRKLLERKSMFSSFLSALERSLWEKSHETQDHAKRLQDHAVKLGRAINLPEGAIDDLVLLARLHDVGKIAIPEKILQKSSDLNKEEWEIMKRHSEIGYNIVSSSPHTAHIGESVLCHHERWDGLGYPNQYQKEEIPITSRIIAIVDAYDVMTNPRPYKRATSSPEAKKELMLQAGSQFDPLLVEQFLEILKQETPLVGSRAGI